MTNGSEWTGRVGDTWAAEWQRTDRSLADLSRQLDPAILAAAPAHVFRALDIGCGAGATSLALAAARPDAAILGVDLSKPLVDVARTRAAAIDRSTSTGTAPTTSSELNEQATSTGPRFLTGDVESVATVHAPFDLMVSRHGVMFFDDPLAAFAALRAAMVPDGRLIFSCFGAWWRNGFACEIGAAFGNGPPPPGPGPFAFADPDHVATLLDGAGWRQAEATEVAFRYRAGSGDDSVADALSFLQRIGPAASVLRAAAPTERPVLLDRLRTVIERHRTADAIDFPASAWIWSARA